MEIQKIIQVETLRMKLYKVLSQGFHFPDKEGIRLFREQVNALNPAESAPHISILKSLLTEPEEIKVLAIDYSRLFIGPYNLPAPPYGSVFLEAESRVMGDSTADVEKRYSRFGIGMADSFEDMPDHIAAELEFMFFLIHKEMEFIRCDQAASVWDILLEQQSFLNAHLHAWVPEFTKQVIEHSKTKFYGALAKAVQQFVSSDAEYVNRIKLPAVERG